MKTEKVVCCNCGSNKIQARAWINVNTLQIIDLADECDYYCEDCDEIVDTEIIEVDGV